MFLHCCKVLHCMGRHSLFFHSLRVFLYWYLENNMDPKFSKLTCHLKLQGLFLSGQIPEAGLGIFWWFAFISGILVILISGDQLENELALTSSEIGTLASPRSGIKSLFLQDLGDEPCPVTSTLLVGLIFFFPELWLAWGLLETKMY